MIDTHEIPSVYLGTTRRLTVWGPAETSRADWNEETVTNVRRLEGILQRAGLGPRRLRVRVAEGERHSEAAWAARLPEALEFLFGG